MSIINLALCITELHVGGAERCLAELALRADRNRFAPTVYCLSARPREDAFSFVPMLETAGVPVVFLGGRRAVQFPAVVGRLKKHLVARKTDVLQSFLFHANIVGRIAARWAGVPAVVSGIRVAERGAHWHTRLDRLTQKWVDRYVCVSQASAEFTARQGGIPPEKITVIPNGINLDAYPSGETADRATLGLRTDRRWIVFVGRLERQKGVEHLIESAPKWLAQTPEHDLLIVGDGPLREKLESACRLRGIADRVHFTGRRSDVPALLSESDLLVLPSLWEGMPNVVLEAMAARRPEVATDVEGVRELLGPGAAEQIVSVGDAVAWTRRIVRFALDRTLAESVGLENRRRAERHFTIASMVSAYEDLWESAYRLHFLSV